MQTHIVDESMDAEGMADPCLYSQFGLPLAARLASFKTPATGFYEASSLAFFIHPSVKDSYIFNLLPFFMTQPTMLTHSSILPTHETSRKESYNKY